MRQLFIFLSMWLLVGALPRNIGMLQVKPEFRLVLLVIDVGVGVIWCVLLAVLAHRHRDLKGIV